MAENTPQSFQSHQINDPNLSARLGRYYNLTNNFTTLSQVTKLQEVIRKDHMNTEQRLEEFIKESHEKHNEDIRKVELKKTNLTSALTNFHTALEHISISSNKSLELSKRIRTVENERNKVQITLKFIEDCRLLKSNISVIQNALEDKNYHLAADAIQEIRGLPPQVIRSEFANRVVPSSEIPDPPAQLLDDWTIKLSKIFHEQFLHASRVQNMELLTSYFQLFPKIGNSEMGLDIYSKHVCNILAEQSRKIMMGQIDKPHMFFSQALLHLFKTVSTIINDHSKIITKSYGAQNMVYVMDKIQKEADLQAGLIWDTFMDTRRMDKLLDGIKIWDESRGQWNKQQHFQQGSGHYSAEQDLPCTLNELSLLVSEYSAILQNWSMYCRFFALMWNEFSEKQVESLEIPDILSTGKFNEKVINSLGQFEILVKHHLYRSFSKAVELEELPSLNNYLENTEYKHEDLSSYPISSILEDLVLFLRTNLIATVNTGQTTLLSHFLGNLMGFIQSEYLIKVLQTRLKSIQQRLNSSLTLKKYIPPSEQTPVVSRSASPKPQVQDTGSKLSQFGFTFKSAATNTFTNLQSNLQSVYTDEDSILKLHHCLIYINTLSLGDIFFERLLIKEILQDQPKLLSNNFPFKDDSKRMADALSSLCKNIQTQNGKLLRWSLNQLFENLLQGRLKKMMSPLFSNGNDEEYICTAHDFENLSKLHQFVVQWKTLLRPFQNVLHKATYTNLLTIMVDWLCQLIEDRIWQIRCNELGALKLDRELSIFITTLCEQQYFLREKFTRLTQIILILGFDDDDIDITTQDIKDETLSSINWVLSSQERINARSLRMDTRN
ncbi:Golgi transport complex subunit COG4 Ecym_2616 [Eremothecium cymbalariae DBVPG|uniref:Conserved oligomeric Golgi complex subunit 4 n=1 Tax=Eremothecium cymbalariae (strain CBS 270.75 / DBVPG 7215 / KCTC 17166 / NRRL Y-17582) TaxID=931890 RepID=G8JQJ6_ERECY|nr:Hypothetical protein Ecym_2616 [Eremothecium cymbalariae DBVPG\